MTLEPAELSRINAYWRAANYISVGQLYLYDNPLLREPLKMEHIKPLVLLCHKCNLTSPQHGQRGSLLAIARAMSNRNVEIESGTCRCTRPAAAREVTFG